MDEKQKSKLAIPTLSLFDYKPPDDVLKRVLGRHPRDDAREHGRDARPAGVRGPDRGRGGS